MLAVDLKDICHYLSLFLHLERNHAALINTFQNGKKNEL